MSIPGSIGLSSLRKSVSDCDHGANLDGSVSPGDVECQVSIFTVDRYPWNTQIVLLDEDVLC